MADAPAKPDKRKASKSAEKQDIPVRERTKSVGPPLPVVDPPKITPAIPAVPSKDKPPDIRPRSRSKELPPPEAKVRERTLTLDIEPRSRTPAKRATELLDKNKKKGEIYSGRVDLGAKVQAWKAKNRSEEAAEPTIVVTKRGRVPSMVARIENGFKETIDSPRNRKEFKLNTQFKARPRMSSLPAPMLRITQAALAQ